jgi:hypothetical protein
VLCKVNRVLVASVVYLRILKQSLLSAVYGSKAKSMVSSRVAILRKQSEDYSLDFRFDFDTKGFRAFWMEASRVPDGSSVDAVLVLSTASLAQKK